MPTSSIENNATSSTNARKTDDTDKLKVSAKFFGKAIQQARMGKMSQKDLASKVNVKIQVMCDYESGKSVPNGQIISKMEKILDVKLPRPGMKTTAPKVSSKCGVAKVGPQIEE